MNFKHLIIALLALTVLSCAKKETSDHITYPAETGPLGDSAMVASAHPLATKVGVEIMRNGGNAYDAAVAVQFALTVVYPQAGNIGGGGFAVVRENDGSIASLDFREKAPAAATRDMYLDSAGQFIPELSTLGHLASGVPGSVAGMWDIHQKYGSKPWAELVQPAINLAFDGYELTKKGAGILNYVQDRFKKANTYEPWVINPEGWKEGDLVVQKELAATLSFIRDNGRDGFYKGIVADQIVKEMVRGNGIITAEDLESYQPAWREPVVSEYKGNKVIGMPPASSGGVAVAQLLYGAEKVGLGNLEHNSAEYVHLMAELEKRVYADRTIHLGDMDYYDVPMEMLLNSDYLDERFEDISLDQVTPSTEITHGEISMTESEETTHFSIVDPQGNAVSITTTLNGSMGSCVIVKGAGFLLNNEMDDFSAKPGVPNMFGLLGSEANAIEPGKRMLSSMTPTIIEKDGELKAVIGTPGGATIITSVFQTILNVLDHDMGMQNAVNAAKAHHQWYPDSIQLENNRFPIEVIEQLEEMGHGIKYRNSTGRMDCILIRPDGKLEGGSDYIRGDNYSEGF